MLATKKETMQIILLSMFQHVVPHITLSD